MARTHGRLRRQCHDHKYDPITQKDYYRLFAFFNNVPENGLDGAKGNAVPLLLLPAPDKESKLAQLKADVGAAEEKVKNLEAELPAAQAALETEWLTSTGKHSGPDGLVAQFSLIRRLRESMPPAPPRKLLSMAPTIRYGPRARLARRSSLMGPANGWTAVAILFQIVAMLFLGVDGSAQGGARRGLKQNGGRTGVSRFRPAL